MSTPRLVRVVSRRVAPGLMADRDRRYERRYRERTGATRMAAAITSEPRVISGPFEGMVLTDSLADVDAAAAKLLGSYEEEIADVFVQALEDGTRTFVDVGCADGYYATGMAFASPILTTYAFDIAGSARDLCRQTAALNRVEARVRVGGRCDAAALGRLELDEALVLIDVEGAEVAFLNDDVVKLLSNSSVVIEVHEDAIRGAGETLSARFAATHAVRRVTQAPRLPARHPRLAEFSHDEAQLALSEHRAPELFWLILTP